MMFSKAFISFSRGFRGIPRCSSVFRKVFAVLPGDFLGSLWLSWVF